MNLTAQEINSELWHKLKEELVRRRIAHQKRVLDPTAGDTDAEVNKFRGRALECTEILNFEKENRQPIVLNVPGGDVDPEVQRRKESAQSDYTI